MKHCVCFWFDKKIYHLVFLCIYYLCNIIIRYNITVIRTSEIYRLSLGVCLRKGRCGYTVYTTMVMTWYSCRATFALKVVSVSEEEKTNTTCTTIRNGHTLYNARAFVPTFVSRRLFFIVFLYTQSTTSALIINNCWRRPWCRSSFAGITTEVKYRIILLHTIMLVLQSARCFWHVIDEKDVRALYTDSDFSVLAENIIWKMVESKKCIIITSRADDIMLSETSVHRVD